MKFALDVEWPICKDVRVPCYGTVKLALPVRPALATAPEWRELSSKGGWSDKC